MKLEAKIEERQTKHKERNDDYVKKYGKKNTEKLWGPGSKKWRCSVCQHIYTGDNDSCPECGANRALKAMPVNYKNTNKVIVRAVIVDRGASQYITKSKTGSIVSRALVGSLINSDAALIGGVTGKKITSEIKSKEITFAINYSDESREIIKTKVGSPKYNEIVKFL